MRLLTVIAISMLALACNNTSNPTPTSDSSATAKTTSIDTATAVFDSGVQKIRISTPKGEYNVWTRRIGNNPTIKVLLLHGGPGGTHEVFESFEKYLPKENIEFIYYDQLGSFKSDNPMDSILWTTDRFVQEVEQVRTALHLDSSNFYLLGHSWGGILAMEYALKYQQHLKGLVISNMMSSCPAYAAYNKNVLQKQMNKKVVDSILMFEAKNQTADPRYMSLLMNHYYNEHVCRVTPFPEPLQRMFSHVNTALYTVMQGPSEFGISGRLATWDRTTDLPKIKVPTLVIRGIHDTMDPAFMKMMSEKFPKGSLVTCPDGSHCSMWDDQAHYFPGLIRFLTSGRTM